MGERRRWLWGVVLLAFVVAGALTSRRWRVFRHAEARRFEGKGYGFAAAREEVKGFTVSEGLKASLFAAEPMIQNPTNMDIDSRGRVWCVECVNYRSTFNPWGILRPEGDRVVILEDTKGDGVADKETAFFQSPELTNPLGICVLPQPKGVKVIVSAAPYVWLLTDDEGHDKVTKAQKLFKIGGNYDDDHSVHAFVFGSDGKFYFNTGDEGRKLMWPDGSVVKDMMGNEVTSEGRPYRHGLILRCDIDLEKGVASHVEVLGHNVRNSFETCIDSFGNLWQSDNDDDGNKAVRLNQLMDFGNYGYGDELTGEDWKTPRTNMEARIPLRHWHQNDPGVVPNLALTGAGSPAGICINEGNGLGVALQNRLLLCDAGPRVVRAVSVTRQGAGYQAEISEMLASEDPWFRPVDCCIAPDGSLFVADWYDPVIGGHNMGDNQKGHVRGRIYRVASPGKDYRIHAPDLSSPEGCVDALRSPSNSTRYAAWTALHSMGAKAENALVKLCGERDPRLRARALHLLMRLPNQQKSHAEKALADPEVDVRATALRELRIAAVEGTLPPEMMDLAAWLLPHLQSEQDKLVLREYALCLRTSAAADSFAAAWTALAAKHDGHDRWYLEALGIASTGREDRAFQAWLSAVGSQWNTEAGRDIVWRVRSSLALEFLTQLLTDEVAEVSTLPRYLREFDFLPDGAAKDRALLKIASANAHRKLVGVDVLKRLSKSSLRGDPEAQKTLQTLLEEGRGQPEFLELVQAYALESRFQEALAAVLKQPDMEGARDFVHFMLAKPNGAKLAAETLAGQEAETLIHLLGGDASHEAITLLAAVAGDGKRDLTLREAAIKEMTLTAPGALALVELAEHGGLPENLKSEACAALAMVQYPGVNERAAKVFGTASSADSAAHPAVAELVKLKGSAEAGREIFERPASSCTLCHRVGSRGVDFAPTLDDIGSKLGKEAIYDSIIHPSAGIAAGFETTQLVLKDGQNILGIVRGETREQLTLAFPGGATGAFLKADMVTRKILPTSMMPEGLPALFSHQELAHLVEYLSTLRGKSSKKEKTAAK